MEVHFADGLELFFEHNWIWGALRDAHWPSARGFWLPVESGGIFGDAAASDGPTNANVSCVSFWIFLQYRAGVLMRRAIFNFGVVVWLLGFAANRAGAQSGTYSGLPPESRIAGSSGSSGAQQVDGVAARIEDDIITESEVRELSEFQQLVDGKSKPRAELIRELSDQWLIRTEATATKYGQPP